MVDEDLPPYLRESDPRQRHPLQQIPLEPPAEPLPEPDERNEERPVDPFLRRG